MTEKKKNGFSSEIKAAALQMLQSGATLKETATSYGCSVASLQGWRKASKKGSKKRTKKVKRVAKATVERTELHWDKFDEFAQGYWRESADTAMIFQLPPDLMPKAVEYVNSVLAYAYTKLDSVKND